MAYITTTQFQSGLVASKNYTDTIGGNKVDKVDGKGLSTEDYTSAEKTKLGALSEIKSVGAGLTLNAETGELTATGGGTADAVAWENVTGKPTTFYDDTALQGAVTQIQTDLANYYLKSETYSKTEIDNQLSAIPKFAISAVSALPTTDISNTTVYLVNDQSDTNNIYTEYIYVNNAWEKLGTAAIDLTNYVTTTALNTALADYTTTADLTTLLAGKADAADIPEAADDTEVSTMISNVFGA